MLRSTCLLALAAIAASSSAQVSVNPLNSGLQKVTVPASSLGRNQLGDPATDAVLIYLPSSYSASSKRYPVLYILHGFSLHATYSDWGEVIQQAMAAFEIQHPENSFIVVIPNGFNAVDGSFYEDSSISGNWDEYVSKTLVNFVDSHYRTIPSRNSRAVVGHSMGGFGALRMMMLHPAVFSVGYALSPCCLDFVADFTSSNPAWRQTLELDTVPSIQAAAAADKFWPVALAAFAVSTTPGPSTDRVALYPYRLRGAALVEVPEIVARWKAVMPLNMIETHLPELRQARAIGIDYGFSDPFTHIPATAPEMVKRLMENDIPVEAGAYPGDHNSGVVERVERVVLPFVAAHLVFDVSSAPGRAE